MKVIRFVAVVTAWGWMSTAWAADPAILDHCLQARGDATTHVYVGELETGGRWDCLALQVDCSSGCMTRLVLLPGMTEPASEVVGASPRQRLADVRAGVTVFDRGRERPIQLTYTVLATPYRGKPVGTTRTILVENGRLQVLLTRPDNAAAHALLDEQAPIGGGFIQRSDLRPTTEPTDEFPWKGLRPFEQDGLWGLLDESDRVVLPARHTLTLGMATPWLAAVYERAHWYVVDRHGETLFEAYVEDGRMDGFSEGLARFVKEGRIGYYDRLGRVVIPARYDEALPFEGGVARVLQDGSWSAIDARGATARAR